MASTAFQRAEGTAPRETRLRRRDVVKSRIPGATVRRVAATKLQGDSTKPARPRAGRAKATVLSLNERRGAIRTTGFARA